MLPTGMGEIHGWVWELKELPCWPAAPAGEHKSQRWGQVWPGKSAVLVNDCLGRGTGQAGPCLSTHWYTQEEDRVLAMPDWVRLQRLPVRAETVSGQCLNGL